MQPVLNVQKLSMQQVYRNKRQICAQFGITQTLKFTRTVHISTEYNVQRGPEKIAIV